MLQLKQLLYEGIVCFKYFYISITTNGSATSVLWLVCSTYSAHHIMLHSIFLSHTLHTIQFQRLAESLIAKSMLGSHMSLILIICENLYKSHFPSPYGPQNACISERYFLRRTNQTTWCGRSHRHHQPSEWSRSILKTHFNI